MADLTPAQLVALASEINTDPKALAYAGKNNVQVAAILNTVGASAEKVRAGIVAVQVLLNAIDGVELDALTTGKKMTLQIYFSGGSVDTNNDNVRAGIGSVFAAGTASRANLLAAVDRSGSRAEVLFGSGAIVQPWEVGRALGRAT